MTRAATNGRSTECLNVESTALRFDYNSVPSSVAKFLSGQADRIRRQCVTSIIQIGKALIEAKHHLSHGAFIRWVEGEVCIPARNAQAYMRVASWASNKGATVAHLPPSVLYLLAASSTPEKFVADILKRAEAGEYIVPSVTREELKAMRTREQQNCNGEDHFAEQTSSETPAWQPFAVDDKASGGVDELFAILVHGLSATDFERVRDIITSDAVLSDPHLAENIKRAFMRNGPYPLQNFETTSVLQEQ